MGMVAPFLAFPAQTAAVAAAVHNKQRKLQSRERASRRTTAEARREREKSIRDQLRAYYRRRPQGGGPGAPIIGGAQIAADVEAIKGGATAAQVLG